ncbi:hypothetical protein StoSoilB13_15100 [Arthrobacter sp. StoSoilB13]|nr:hypothetical protein StoSoilB13_15100 [Arthrobacter sp. StoSoilB13]
MRGNELCGGLGFVMPAGLRVRPVNDQGFVAAEPAQGGQGMPATDEEFADEPVLGPVLVHRDVLDRCIAAIGKGDAAIKHFRDHERFRAPLFETTQVHQARANDLGLVDGGDPGHRYEDALLAGHFHHDAYDMRGAAGPSGEHDDVAQPA